MEKFLTIIELKAALLDLNQKKGLPLQLIEIKQQAAIKFTATRDFSSYKRQFTYQRDPYKVIEILHALPDVKPGFNWSLLGKFL